MSESEIDFSELADVYLRYITHHSDSDLWAMDEVDRLLRQLNDGIRIVTLLIDKSDSDRTLTVVAAGPLEDLLDLHSFDALNLIERAAVENPRLQKALSLVHVSFWHELFERWYLLKCNYGFSEPPTDNPIEVVARVIQSMRAFVSGEMKDWAYQEQIGKLLAKPVDSLDERRKSLLRQAGWDCEMVDGRELLDSVRSLLPQLEA